MNMATSFTWLLIMCVWTLIIISYSPSAHGVTLKRWPVGSSTRYYEFKVQSKSITKLCNRSSIIAVNDIYPGPVIYAQEDDRVLVRVTNVSPYNLSIHWHGIRQRLSCWSDGPAYVTQCPIKPGETYTYEFTVIQQKGTFFWHAHFSWLRATVNGALIVYPKTGVPYPFPYPYEEHIIILGEYWSRDMVQLEQSVLASGGGPPIADAYTINGHPGPNYNCSNNDVYKLNVVPGKTYLLRLINAGLNTENFFGISNHKLTVVEADAEYVKPFTTDKVMLGPGQTMNVLVTANQPIGRYSMAVGPYMSAQNVPFQNITSVAYFQYIGATPNSLSLPAALPNFNDNLSVKTVMDGLRGLNTSSLPKEIDQNLFITIGLNVQKCNRKNPNQTCQGLNGGIFAASMNNFTFFRPRVSLLEAYYRNYPGYFTDDFPAAPLKFYDFVNGAPNNAPNDTGAVNETRVFVLEYGTRVQVILQDTGTVSTENHPVHLHGYNFYVVGYGTGNYNPDTANFNLVDPPYMNTIGVPVGGWAAIRFTADNPGTWFMHCHLDIHLSWGFATVFIVKNGEGPLETLPHPPADYPRC